MSAFNDLFASIAGITPQTAGGFGATGNPQPGFNFGPSRPDPWMMMLMRMMMGQQQPTASAGPDFGALLTQLRNDPQGDANKGYIPGVNNAFSPFSNGFFNTSAADLKNPPNRQPNPLERSQGGNAMNQWLFPGKFEWSAAPTTTMAQDAVNASPPMFRVSPDLLGAAGIPQRPYALGDERDPKFTGYVPGTTPTPTPYPRAIAPTKKKSSRSFGSFL